MDGWASTIRARTRWPARGVQPEAILFPRRRFQGGWNRILTDQVPAPKPKAKPLLTSMRYRMRIQQHKQLRQECTR